MDLQLSQEIYPYANSNYEFVGIVIVLTTLIVFIIDHLQLKTLVDNEKQSNRRILYEINQINKNLSTYAIRSSQLEIDIVDINKKLSRYATRFLQLEMDIADVNKNINVHLDKQTEYIDRQFNCQTETIEDINVKLFHAAEEISSYVSGQIEDIKTKLFESVEELQTDVTNQIEEMDAELTEFANKIETSQCELLHKLEEKSKLDKKVAYDMYCYLMRAFHERGPNSVKQVLHGFFHHFYDFDYNIIYSQDICDAVDKIPSSSWPQPYAP
jgi:hypothetical protein